MAQQDQETVHAFDVLRQLYARYEAPLQERLGLVRVSCKKGCWSCCTMLNLVQRTEALYIANHLLSDPRWRLLLPTLLPKLRADAIQNDYMGIGKDSYFRKRLPCTFLDPESKACTIYDVRPSSCRYHYAISPPEKCSADAPEGTITEMLNTEEYKQGIWMVDQSVFSDDPGISAPLPLSVLWALKTLVLESEPPRDEAERTLYTEILRQAEGMKSPNEWIKTHATTVLLDMGYDGKTLKMPLILTGESLRVYAKKHPDRVVFILGFFRQRSHVFVKEVERTLKGDPSLQISFVKWPDGEPEMKGAPDLEWFVISFSRPRLGQVQALARAHGYTGKPGTPMMINAKEEFHFPMEDAPNVWSLEQVDAPTPPPRPAPEASGVIQGKRVGSR